MNKPKATNRKKLVAFALLICKADVSETAYPKSGEIRFDEIGLLHFFCESLRWRVSQKPMDCECRQLTMWSSLSGRSTEGGKPFVHGYRECNIPVQVKGGSLAQLSGVSPLSTGYYLSQNCSKDAASLPLPCGENLNGG